MATPRSRATGTGVTKLPPTDNGGVGETLGENREEKCITSVLLGLQESLFIAHHTRMSLIHISSLDSAVSYPSLVLMVK